MIIGSRPSDHYFRSVCWFVCLFVCLFVQFFSAVFDPISIKLGHMLYVWVQLCPLEYRGCVTPGGWVTLKNLYFYGFSCSKNYLVLQFSSDCPDFWLHCRTHQYKHSLLPFFAISISNPNYDVINDVISVLMQPRAAFVNKQCNHKFHVEFTNGLFCFLTC